MFQHRLNIRMMNEFLAILKIVESQSKYHAFKHSLSLSVSHTPLSFRFPFLVSRFIVWHDTHGILFVCLIESQVINNYWFIKNSSDAQLFINDCYFIFVRIRIPCERKQNKTEWVDVQEEWRASTQGAIFSPMWNFQLDSFHRNGMLLIIYSSSKMIKFLANQRKWNITRTMSIHLYPKVKIWNYLRGNSPSW